LDGSNSYSGRTLINAGTLLSTSSTAAFDSGLVFVVGYHDSLAATPWISAVAGSVLVDRPLQTVEASILAAPDGRRFHRRRVATP